MSSIPSSMASNFSYECPYSGKAFAFTREKGSRQAALAAQQAHTAAEIQRLERQAGRTLSHRELFQAGWTERQQAAAAAKDAEAKAAEEAAAKAAKPKEAPTDPLSVALMKTAFPYAD